METQEHRVPKSPSLKLEGLVYFPRMLDKIRIHAEGCLHPDYQEKLGHGFDAACCEFLGIDHVLVSELVAQGLDDVEVFEKIQDHGRRVSPDEVAIWSAYLSKRGWRDEVSDVLAQRKIDLGLEGREDVQTFFDMIDADEGRL